MLTITLWKYSAPQYPWISENMGLLRRDFLIQDLMDAVEESDIEGVVTVQARQALAETRWLLDLARTHDLSELLLGGLRSPVRRLTAIWNISPRTRS
jgi:L-fuconolactonase